MKKVEQVTVYGKVVEDFDTPIKRQNIPETLSKYFQFNPKQKTNPFSVTYKGKALALCAVSVTYLGHPHPIFKKRIQMRKEWQPLLAQKNFLLLGVYQYDGLTLFVAYDTSQYRHHKLNNSSAHVSTLDLRKGVEYGVFSKIDRNGNPITVCREDKFEEFLDSYTSGQRVSLPKEISIFDGFASAIPLKWVGTDCYKEMFAAEYRNAGQAEWPGFYLEFLFERYLEKNPSLKNVCLLVSDKGAEGLDFDLNFHNDYRGDLKCHSESSSGILGNDKESVCQVVEKDGRLWYVVFIHSTEKDSAHGCVVSEYWNSVLQKPDKHSYSKKMKHSVRHKLLYVLEINGENIRYLKDFNQGKQPSGEKRRPKIMIPHKSIDNFSIYKKVLQ